MATFGPLEVIEPKVIIKFGDHRFDLTRKEAEGLALYILNDVLGLSYGEVGPVPLSPASAAMEFVPFRDTQAEDDAKVEALVRQMAAAKFASFEPAPNGTG